jgi:hypothetical protein
MKDKIKQLKSIGRAIAKYPDDKFVSNCLNSREVKIQIYMWGRDFESGKATCEQELEAVLESAKQELKILVSGNTVKALICP